MEVVMPKVIINVWYSKIKDKSGEITLVENPSLSQIVKEKVKGQSIKSGHVSIQTLDESGNESIYASLWPPYEPDLKYGKGCDIYISEESLISSSVNGRLTDSFTTDKLLLRKKPDKQFTLTCLNVDEIEAAFYEFKESNASFDLYSSVNPFTSECHKNCSGLTILLLSAGGIYDVIKHLDESNLGSIGLSFFAYNSYSAYALATNGVNPMLGICIFIGKLWLSAGTGIALEEVDAMRREIKNIITPRGIATLAERIEDAEKNNELQHESSCCLL